MKIVQNDPYVNNPRWEQQSKQEKISKSKGAYTCIHYRNTPTNKHGFLWKVGRFFCALSLTLIVVPLNPTCALNRA